MALSRAEKLRLLDGGGDDDPSADSAPLSREQKIALLNGSGSEPEATPKRGLRDDVTFLGSEKLGRVMSGVFPRTAESVAKGKPYLNQAMGAGLDQLSSGRFVAALPEAMKGGEAYLKSAADTEGDSFVGKVLRDPGTGAAILSAPLGGFLGGAAKGAFRAGSLAGKFSGLGVAGAAEGAASAIAHQTSNVQEGRDVNLGQAATEVALNTVLPIAGSVVGSAIKKGAGFAGKILKGTGEKMITSTIRPSIKDVKDGFRIDNVFKHGLEGTLEETEQKLDSKFADLTNQLKRHLRGSQEKLDMLDMLDDATKSITGDKAAHFGKNAHMEKAAEFLLAEIQEAAPNGVVDLSTAQVLKRGIGKIGAWTYGQTDPEASARETLANALYLRLKKEIEDKAPEGVREINKQLSELIPIERAVTRRIPVEARNSGLSLSDFVSTGAGMGLGGASDLLDETGIPGSKTLGGLAAGLAFAKLRKSPMVAKGLYRAGAGLGSVDLSKGLAPFRLAGRRAASTTMFSGMDEQE